MEVKLIARPKNPLNVIIAQKLGDLNNGLQLPKKRNEYKNDIKLNQTKR